MAHSAESGASDPGQGDDLSLVFYHREDCHLCEAMALALDDYIHRRGGQAAPGSVDPSSLEIIYRDIDDNPAWHARYREYIPVLVFRGEELCHYFFEEAELDRALGLHPAAGGGRMERSPETDSP